MDLFILLNAHLHFTMRRRKIEVKLTIINVGITVGIQLKLSEIIIRQSYTTVYG